jgi:thiol:disulfide interchange protein DsbD
MFGFYVWQIANVDSATERPGLSSSIGKALGFAAILWGCLALVGHATGGRDIFSPLSELSLGTNTQSKVELPFETTTTLTQTLSILDQAKQAEQPVLIDFYADWCFDCVRMKRTTFKEAEVARALAGWRLVMIDVTDTGDISQEVQKHFKVFGPPATLIISKQGHEREDLRQYGYMDTGEFLTLISRVER